MLNIFSSQFFFIALSGDDLSSCKDNPFVDQRLWEQ
jgi:hypothetical protein